MRTPTAVSVGWPARCLSLRFLAGLGRPVALLLGEAAPDAVDLPGPQRERETREPDRAAQIALASAAGIPSEDRLTAEDKHGLTKLFWGISAGPSNPRSGPRRSVRSAAR
jgi:hypothetical protein